MRGPVGTVLTLNQRAKIESQLQIARKLAALEAGQTSNDPDSDGFIEPMPPDLATAGCTALITGGGCLPVNVGAAKTDPWGTLVGYCGWNHGPTNTAGGNLLAGTNDQTHTVLAVISAGPDRTFQTSCADDPAYVTTGGDDLVFEWTYDEASEGLGGGLWSLKSGDPNAITTNKDVQFASGTTATFDNVQADFGAGSRLDLGGGGLFNLPTETVLQNGDCTAANRGVLRRQTNGGTDEILQICDGSAWQNVGSVSGGTPAYGNAGEVQFNSGGSLYSVPGFFWDKAASRLGVNNGAPNDTLDVAGTAQVTGAVALDSTLNVGGASTLASVGVTNNATVGGTLGVTGAATLSSTTHGVGAADFDSTFNADGAATLGSTLGVTGATTLSSTLGVTGATTLGSTLDVTGAGDFASTLNADGATTLGSTLAVTGAATLSSTLGVTGATTLGSTLSVAGNISDPDSDVTINDGIDIIGAARLRDLGSGQVAGGDCSAFIAGAITFDGTNDELLLCSSSAGNTWVTVGTSGGGGGGAGATTVWERSGTVIRTKTPAVNSTDDLVFGSPQLADDGDATHSNRMFFDKSKGAFRAGGVTGTEWDDASVGANSIALGVNTKASGVGSVALGITTTASNVGTVAMGANNYASAFYSTAIGYGASVGSTTAANGNGSGAIAFGLIDPSTVTITTAPKVTGDQSMGIFMDDQDGLVMTAANTMGLFGGRMVIDPNVPATQLAVSGILDLDVEGEIGAIQYCDETGSYCFDAADVSSGTLGAPGNDREVIFNSGGVLGTDANFVFTSAGALGIGTANPTSKLTVNGGNIELFGGSYVQFDNFGNNAIRGGAAGGGYLEFSTAGAIRQVIDNAGNVGIGTATPAARLHVAAANDGILMENTAGAANQKKFSISNSADILGVSSNLDNGTSRNAYIMAITGAGQVGIRTPTPQADFDINTTGAMITPRGDTSQRPGTAVNGMIRYNSQTGKFEGYQAGAWTDIITAGGTAAAPDRGIQFNSGGSFAADSNFVYTSTGLLGIGTSTPTAALDVGLSTDAYINLGSNGNSTYGYQFYNRDDLGLFKEANSFNMYLSGLDDVRINIDSNNNAGSSFSIGGNGNGMTGGTQLFTVLDTGNVGIGTTSPASKFVVAPPASEAVAGAAVITADACGSIKQITSVGNVTTNTTNTFTAPTASYAGCCMDVVNVDTADTITLDSNAKFLTGAGTDIALAPNKAVRVCSDGAKWYQAAAVSSVASGGSSAIDDLSDAYTGYGTTTNFIMGRTSAAALTAGAQYNTFVGEGAGATTANSTATTDSNTAVGYFALSSLTSGSGNAAIGYGALLSITSGSDNSALGKSSLLNNTTGSQGVALGSGALQSNTVGNNNTALGYGSLNSNVAKSESTAIGLHAMYYADSAAGGAVTYNTAVGAYALQGSTTAANNTGTYNTALGHTALPNITSGSRNTAVGAGSLYNTTTGTDNTAVGRNSLANNTTGQNNIAMGEATLANNTTKRESTAIGYAAMQYADSAAGGAITYNTAVGAYALRGSTTAANNTGTSNTAIGHSALAAATSGGSNVAIGSGTGDTITTGGTNILLGYNIDTPAATTSNHLNIGGTIYGDLSTDNVRIGGSGAVSAGPFIANPPTSAAVAAAGTIAADACGTIKQVYVGAVGTSTGSVTTSTTDTFTTPAAANSGCCMDVVSIETGTDNITLDSNANFKTGTGSDIVLAPGKAVRVCSNGSAWYQDAPMSSLTAGSVAISGLTAAGATNSIDNADYAQTWTWNTLAGATGLKLSSTSTAAASNAQKMFEIALSGANGTATQTTYGAYLTNTHTGATSTNVGLYASASGATNNYAAIFENGSVGIGTTAPTELLHVQKTTATIARVLVENTNAGSGAGARFEAKSDNGGTAFLSKANTNYGNYAHLGTGSNDFLFSTDGSFRMVIKTNGDVGVGDYSITAPAAKFVVAPPASEAVAGAAVITANACGTIKQITSVGNVTTNTTNTFTAPTASYAGCCMDVVNVDTADTITLDSNAKFLTGASSDIALAPNKAVRVCSDGSKWYQAAAVSSVAGGGTTTFVSLSDVPSSYTSQSKKYLRVNTGETAVEFTNEIIAESVSGLSLPTGMTLDNLSDVTASGAATSDGISYNGSGWVLNSASTGAFLLPSGTAAQRPTAANGMMRYKTDATIGFEVREAGAWVAMGAAASDIRLKTEIQKLDSKEVLARLDQVQGYSYRLKEDGEGVKRYGVIAQELENVFPELVNSSADPKEMKSVRYLEFTALLIEASKELKAENDSLRTEVNDMKTQLASIDDLRRDIDGLKAHTGYGINKAQLGAGIIFGMAGGGFIFFLIGVTLRNRKRNSAG